MGTENKVATDTKMKFSRMKDRIIAFSELPNIFLTPISLVLDCARNSVRPNNPNAQISKLKSAKIETMTVRFFSEE